MVTSIFQLTPNARRRNKEWGIGNFGTILVGILGFVCFMMGLFAEVIH